jgi:adenylylsulfate kinase
MSDQPHIVWHQHSVSRAEREAAAGHGGCVVWFTGLSGCGKSTIANVVDRRLHERGVRSFVLDGDNIRHGLCATPAILSPEHGEEFARRFGLGFSPQDREENIRRLGAVAELFAAAGIVVLTAFVSPYRRDRDAVRRKLAKAGAADDFIEIFVDAPLEVCEARDPKGLYKKARAGEIRDFTGIHDPYEPPLNPELRLDSASRLPEALGDEVIALLERRGVLRAGESPK